MSALNGTQPFIVPPESDNAYGYLPSEAISILFITLFSISTILHTGQSLFTRMWWLLPTACLCGAMEILGWSARLWSSFSPNLSTPFQIQITATILAPTPLVAANFVILGKIILRLGPSYSRLSPKWYSIVFCTCDVVSLVIQAIGGGMAASASGPGGDPTPGGNVMLGGIIFQMTTITVYVLCATEFFVRYFKNVPLRAVALKSVDGGSASIRGPMDKRLKLMSAALMFSTLCLFIRAIYRTIELADGWNGRIITTQVYFNVLDGAMIVLAMFTLNFAHPGVLLKPSNHNESLTMKRAPRSDDSSLA